MDIVKGEVASPASPARLALAAVALAVAAFLAWGMYLSSTPEGQARAGERDMIQKCRAAQNDELQDLATRRFMREGCDKMAQDFRAKWGRDP